MENIVIWGTGVKARDFLKDVNWQNVNLVGFVDNNVEMQGKEYVLNEQQGKRLKIRIYSPSELVNELNYDIIVVCSQYECDIMWQCHELKIDKPVVSCFDILKLNNIVTTNKLIYSITEKVQLDEKNSIELLYRNRFTDTLSGYEWWKNTSLSLGEWAVGYNFAYVLVRVLNDFKPKNILELGLGQSSKIINNYVSYYEDVAHEVVEHDREWIDFFSNMQDIDGMRIFCQELIRDEKGEVEYCYDRMEDVVKDKKYSLITIDGPFGGGGIVARTDLLRFIPDILANDFVIMVDDYHRTGERNMVAQLERILKDAGINYYKGVYGSVKDVGVIVSEKWKFLTSL